MKNIMLAIVAALCICATASAAYVIRYNPSCGKWDVIYVPDCAPVYPAPQPCYPAYRPCQPTYYHIYRGCSPRPCNPRPRHCH